MCASPKGYGVMDYHAPASLRSMIKPDGQGAPVDDKRGDTASTVQRGDLNDYGRYEGFFKSGLRQGRGTFKSLEVLFAFVPKDSAQVA